MSGRTKRILYGISVAFFGVLALSATVLLGFFGAIRNENQLIGCGIAFLVFGIFSVFLPVSVLIHEAGHVLFGAIAGLKFISVSFSRVEISTRGIRYAGKRGFSGETQMLPKSERGVRARMVVYTLGGAFLNFVYGIVFLTLFFVLPAHPVLFFFELCAPLNLFEGISALIPAELDSGKTDGKVFAEIATNSDYGKVLCSVLTVQGQLYTHNYSTIRKELLFELPVIREDEPVFLALTQLGWQYLLFNDDAEGSAVQLKRLDTLTDYISDEKKYAEILCDIAYGYADLLNDVSRAKEIFQTAEAASGTAAYARTRFLLHGGNEEQLVASIEKEPALGIREFEKKLIRRIKEKNSVELTEFPKNG